MPHIYRNIIHKLAGRLGILLIADFVMFGTTNAQNVASYLLIVGFLLLMATIYQMVRACLAAAELYGMQVKRVRRLAVGLAGIIGILVALQSIGELSSRDALVLLPLVIVGYLYSFYGETAIIKLRQPV